MEACPFRKPEVLGSIPGWITTDVELFHCELLHKEWFSSGMVIKNRVRLLIAVVN